MSVEMDPVTQVMVDGIPLLLQRAHIGQWVAFDVETGQIAGAGLTEQEAIDQAESVNGEHILYVHFVDPQDVGVQ